MREILFKAQRKDGKGWVFGMPTFDYQYLFNASNLDSPDNYEIIPETICQYTGLKDKNGVKIYKNDIMSDGVMKFKVEWNTTSSSYQIIPIGLEEDNTLDFVDLILCDNLGKGCYDRKDLKIIGNIHDKSQSHD